MPKPFKGVIKLDVRDSKPDWAPFTLKRAPEGAPNVLIVLYDDTGMAAWSPFGGGINMPTLQKLADRGLMYSQWHTTALCSPTRSTFLTGRNHHLNGCSCITEASNGFPGWSGRIPAQCATVGHVLEDNRFTEQPYGPDKGYHVSRDLTDKAIEMLRDQKAANPSRPWFMWFCPGANHAPHHCPKEYVEKYKGKFDDGYEAYREWVLARMIDRGVLPKGTQLTPFNPLPKEVANPGDYVRPWNELNADEKKLFSRMAEVYAGFSEYTDAQVGRIIDHLEQTGQLDNTLIFYCADNGASGEGSPNGSVNENKFFNGYPDDIKENLKYLEHLGGPE